LNRQDAKDADADESRKAENSKVRKGRSCESINLFPAFRLSDFPAFGLSGFRAFAIEPASASRRQVPHRRDLLLTCLDWRASAFIRG